MLAASKEKTSIAKKNIKKKPLNLKNIAKQC